MSSTAQPEQALPVTDPKGTQITPSGDDDGAQSESIAKARPPILRWLVDFKYRLIKVIDVSGLTFLTPIVRLCYGEEPKKQLGDIIRVLIVPVIAFIAFLAAWTVVAPNHKTKSGEVPTPQVVWSAAQGIWSFHTREQNKGRAFELNGQQREVQLAAVNAEIEKLRPYKQAAGKRVREAEEARNKAVDAAIAPLRSQSEALEGAISEAREQREAALAKAAAKLAVGDIDARQAYLDEVRAHLDLKEQENIQLRELGAEEDEVRAVKFAPLEEAKQTQTAIAEQLQYLTKLSEQLGRANRSLRVDSQMAELRDAQRTFVAAEGEETYDAAVKTIRIHDRIQTISDSDYAKPWTLPMQIYRSIACVFVGFLIGTAIAVPVGVLCGLSHTFMAAMTPFIALFKPVSPIVWLPISLIIVGGFIPDPDKHWFILGMAKLPLVGWMKINPAFIASAITVALCSLWATMVNTALGVASIDKDHINVARVLRLGFWDRLFKIIIPSALPLIFAGLRISLGVGWMVLIAGELLSSSEGIGKYVWDQFNNGASDSFAKMMVVVFVVGVIGLLLDRIMIVFQRLVSFEGSVATV